MFLLSQFVHCTATPNKHENNFAVSPLTHENRTLSNLNRHTCLCLLCFIQWIFLLLCASISKWHLWKYTFLWKELKGTSILNWYPVPSGVCVCLILFAFNIYINFVQNEMRSRCSFFRHSCKFFTWFVGSCSSQSTCCIHVFTRQGSKAWLGRFLDSDPIKIILNVYCNNDNYYTCISLPILNMTSLIRYSLFKAIFWVWLKHKLDITGGEMYTFYLIKNKATIDQSTFLHLFVSIYLSMYTTKQKPRNKVTHHADRNP